MAASLTKTQAYVASQYETQTSGSALTVTLVEDDYLWIRQTLATTDTSVTPALTEMVLEASGVKFSPVAGEYISTTTIELSYSDDPTATIYYTTDGTDPDNTDTEYTTAIAIGNFTLKAIAYVGGSPVSDIASATYTVSAYDVAVTISPASGEYGSSQTITISSDDPTATLYYTTDGSDPDDTDTEYTTPIAIDDFTVKAVAYDGTGQVSAIVSVTYTVSDIPIYIGSTKIVKVYIGSTQISGINMVSS